MIDCNSLKRTLVQNHHAKASGMEESGMEENQLRTIQEMVASALWKWLSRTKWRILFTPNAKTLTKLAVLKQQNSNFMEMTVTFLQCRKQRW